MDIFCHFNFWHNRKNRFCCTVCGLIWAHYKAFSISIIIICVHSHPMIAPFFWENLTPYFYCSAVSPRLLQTFSLGSLFDFIWKKSLILLFSIINYVWSISFLCNGCMYQSFCDLFLQNYVHQSNTISGSFVICSSREHIKLSDNKKVSYV